MPAGHDNVVSGIVAHATCHGESLEDRYAVVGLVDHRMRDRTNDGDRIAFVLLYDHAYFRVTDESLRPQNVGNELLGLQLAETGNMQARGNQGNANRTGLAD